MTSNGRAWHNSHSIGLMSLRRCSVCMQTFPDQAELDKHTQLNHPRDYSGSFYIPVERFRPARRPNAMPAGNGIQQTPSLTARITNTKRGGSECNSVAHSDRRLGQSNAARCCEKCGNQDRARGEGRCRCGEHHASQTRTGTPGHPAIIYDGSTPRTIRLAPLNQAPKSSAISGNVDFAGDRRPSGHPATPPKVQQLFCSKCFQWFTGNHAFDGHLVFCPIPSTNRAPLAPAVRCEPCKHDFPTSKALSLHLLNSSVHAPKHQCNLCTSHFATQGALVVHRVIAHGLLFPCDQCDRWFTTEELRLVHLDSAHKKVDKPDSGDRGVPLI